MAKDFLFVYGTLRGDCGNADISSSGCRYMGRANIQGRLYEVAGYPGMVPSYHTGDRVAGELYRLTRIPLLKKLDKYEGSKYRRLKKPVELEDGTRYLTWVYQYRGRVNPLKRIPSGDYLQYRRFSLSRSERHRLYAVYYSGI